MAGRGAQEFDRALEEAAARLRQFSRGVDESTRATEDRNRREQERDSSSGPGAARQAVGGALLAGLAASSAGVGAAQTTGDLVDGFNVSMLGAVHGLGKVPFVGNVLGASQASNVLDRAGGRVAGVTGDLARYGMEVDDEFRQRTIEIAIEQERRVEDERQRTIAAMGDPAALGGAFAGGTAGQAFGTFAEDIRSTLRDIRDSLRGLVGGSN